MELKAQSYPDRIRRIAQELGRLQVSYGVEKTVRKLHVIADELEVQLKKAARKS
jgi:hypothetical protein